MLLGAARLPYLKTDATNAAPVASASLAREAPPLPTKPEDWRGAIDYPAIDNRLQAMMLDPSMQGLAVAIVEDGRLSFVQGYGLTSAESGEPVEPHTVFRWASLSKTVASTLAAQLATEGAFSLTAPLETFHTSLRLPEQAERSLTVEHLLSQRTGLDKNAYDLRLEAGEDPVKLRTLLGTLPAACPPGTCHSYQNIAYDAVTEIITSRTREPFNQTVKRRLFAPLGMESASLGAAGLIGAAHWAKPHRGDHVLPLSEAYYRVPAAAGVNSSIVDLAIWMQAQMGLRPDVLPRTVIDTVHRPRVATARPYSGAIARELSNAGYGLGMRTFSYKGRRIVGHSGAVAGYRSTMVFDPEARTGLVMLWNSDGSLPFRFQLEFFDHAFGLPVQDRLDLKQSLGPRRIAHVEPESSRTVEAP